MGDKELRQEAYAAYAALYRNLTLERYQEVRTEFPVSLALAQAWWFGWAQPTDAGRKLLIGMVDYFNRNGRSWVSK